jgi:hypothetical protein
MMMVFTIAELNEMFKDVEYEALNQCERILKYIAKHGSITSHEAMTKLGIYRLASRINDLKRRGYNIEGKMESGNNRFGEKTSFKVYRFAEVQNEQTHNNAV